mmetsp:Transcript_37270/g.49455  ORF Transcript_37270/g.49455 Transcript_37270/m.49455 type:complete len:89 (+) Transcript_37270:986-1252(+)
MVADVKRAERGAVMRAALADMMGSDADSSLLSEEREAALAMLFSLWVHRVLLGGVTYPVTRNGQDAANSSKAALAAIISNFFFKHTLE